MGYYKGKGVTSGGGESIASIGSYVFPNGTHTVSQLTVSTVTRLSGVSLATAKKAHAESNMSAIHDWYQISSTTGGITFYKEVNFPNAKGTRKTISYSQIGDSNLYELSITDETLKARLDNNGWQS